MADKEDQAQKIDSIKLRVEKQNAEREAAGLPSSPLSSSPAPWEKDPEETLADPNAPEHVWIEAAHELNKEEEKKQRAVDKELKKHDDFQRKFLIVFFSMIILLVGVAVSMPFLYREQPPAQQQYVPPPQSTQDIDFKPYMEALEKSIKSNWHPPKGDSDHIVRVKFKVHKNGEISDLAFDRMSRSPENDAAVIKAIIASMPALPPLPEGSPENVDISFTFEYHVHDGPGQETAPSQK